MNDHNIVVGLDVHKKTVVGAVLYPGATEVSERFTIDNTPGAVRQWVERLAARGPVVFCYEAGPCGYTIQRQIQAMGHVCEVIAPALTPRRPGDRVKTDQRDADKLARFFRAGELSVIRIPSREEEAVRDLVRAREDAVVDRLRARHRLSKFLLRQGRLYQKTKSWGVAHWAWICGLRFDLAALQSTFEAYQRQLQVADEHLADLDQQVKALAETAVYQKSVRYLRCLKGIDTLSALTLVAEVQDFDRFRRAPSFMAFTGLTGSEYSSGDRVIRGSITKVGNPHVRRILVEAAWHSRQPSARESHQLGERRRGCPLEVRQIAYRAQQRLSRKYWRLIHRGKRPQVAVVACARELSGFIWAISRHFRPVLAA